MNKKILIATSAIIIAGGAGLSYFGGFSGLQSSFFHDAISIVDEPVCGNGILEAKEDNSVVEQCDDSNTVDWDNCSSFCQLEQGGGCLDVSAKNYDSNAVFDNKSCNYPVPEKAWNRLQKETITTISASNFIERIDLYSGYENIPADDITDGFIKEISSRYYLYIPYLLNKLESDSKVFEKKIRELNTSPALKVFTEQINTQKNKIDDTVRNRLDLYACTKNKAYKGKNYAYTSLSALDEKTKELNKLLAKTGAESLRVKLATLQAELKKIPTKNTAARKAKNAEITATNLAIKNAQAELTALTSKTNITKCIQPAQVAITQAEAEIKKIQSSPGYLEIEQEISANKLQREELEKITTQVKNEAGIVSTLFGSKMIKPSNDGDNKNNDKDKDGEDGGGDADAVCGNGSIEPGELCDDGNDVDDDYCSNSCSVGQQIEQYCDGANMPCQNEMNEMQKATTHCKQKLDACHRNPSDESLCQESKIACQADEKSEQDLRQCISKESRCLDKFFEHVRPDMQDGWEDTKGPLGL